MGTWTRCTRVRESHARMANVDLSMQSVSRTKLSASYCNVSWLDLLRYRWTTPLQSPAQLSFFDATTDSRPLSSSKAGSSPSSLRPGFNVTKRQTLVHCRTVPSPDKLLDPAHLSRVSAEAKIDMHRTVACSYEHGPLTFLLSCIFSRKAASLGNVETGAGSTERICTAQHASHMLTSSDLPFRDTLRTTWMSIIRSVYPRQCAIQACHDSP